MSTLIFKDLSFSSLQSVVGAVNINFRDRKQLGTLLVIASIIGIIGISSPIQLGTPSTFGKLLLLFILGFGVVLILSDIFNWF